MGYSETRSDMAPVPDWARYAVTFVESARCAVSTVQYFSDRAACERWARAVMRRMPSAAPGELTPTWALVRALPATGRDRIGCAGVCYLSLDPGAVVVKAHAYPPEYGQRAARTTAHAAY